jgi:hypothetical protein
MFTFIVHNMNMKTVYILNCGVVGFDTVYFCRWSLELDMFRLCGLVVRVPGYRSRGPGFDFRRYQIFWEAVDLERGPLSFVSITEELLDGTVAAPV